MWNMAHRNRWFTYRKWKKTQFNTSLLVFRRVSDGEEPDGTCITTAWEVNRPTHTHKKKYRYTHCTYLFLIVQAVIQVKVWIICVCVCVGVSACYESLLAVLTDLIDGCTTLKCLEASSWGLPLSPEDLRGLKPGSNLAVMDVYTPINW